MAGKKGKWKGADEELQTKTANVNSEINQWRNTTNALIAADAEREAKLMAKMKQEEHQFQTKEAEQDYKIGVLGGKKKKWKSEESEKAFKVGFTGSEEKAGKSQESKEAYKLGEMAAKKNELKGTDAELQTKYAHLKAEMNQKKDKAQELAAKNSLIPKLQAKLNATDFKLQEEKTSDAKKLWAAKKVSLELRMKQKVSEAEIKKLKQIQNAAMNKMLDRTKLFKTKTQELAAKKAADKSKAGGLVKLAGELAAKVKAGAAEIKSFQQTCAAEIKRLKLTKSEWSFYKEERAYKNANQSGGLMKLSMELLSKQKQCTKQLKTAELENKKLQKKSTTAPFSSASAP